jgi:hypothetical protein
MNPRNDRVHSWHHCNMVKVDSVISARAYKKPSLSLSFTIMGGVMRAVVSGELQRYLGVYGVSIFVDDNDSE